MEHSHASYGFDRSPWAPTDNHLPLSASFSNGHFPHEGLEPMSDDDYSYGTPRHGSPRWGSLEEGPFDAPCDPIDDLICYSEE